LVEDPLLTTWSEEGSETSVRRRAIKEEAPERSKKLK
jgi:hypothetical protein